MKTILVIFAVLLVLPCIALATPVPDTGQTISYYPGDDGYYAPRNPHSYTKLDANGNDLPDEAPWPWAMVRDNVTGLIWEVKTDDDSIHDKGNVYTWERAMGFGTTLNTEQFGGYSDWRLPTVKELSSLVDSSISYPGPTIDTIYFPNTHPYYYWSSTNLARNRYRAWYVHFDDGHIYDEITANLFSVRAVRGEQSSSFGHFIDNNDGTITNTDTGLMWQKTTAPGTYTWQQALYYCENFSLADYHDWRLPNRNELQSIVDYNRESPPIDPIFNDVGSYYWSSTTAAGYPIYAWGVSFGYDGHMGYGLKYHGGGYVRAVGSVGHWVMQTGIPYVTMLITALVVIISCSLTVTMTEKAIFVMQIR